MGMYDDVSFEYVCPVCEEQVTGFQSKDGDCALDTIAPTSVRNFYSSCSTCRSWLEFTLHNNEVKYKLTVRGQYNKVTREYQDLSEYNTEVLIVNP